jgi:hypothetical protein
MKWISANEKLPPNEEPILIRRRGIFQLAKFDESEKVFIAKNGDRFRVASDILWSGLVKPELSQVS